MGIATFTIRAKAKDLNVVGSEWAEHKITILKK